MISIDKPSSDKKESVGKGKGLKNSSSSKPQGKTSAGSKTSSGTKRKTYTPKAGTSKDSDLNNNDVLDMLKQIRAEQIKTNQKVDDVSKRVDGLYCEGDDGEYEEEYDDYQSDNDLHVDDEQNDTPAKKAEN